MPISKRTLLTLLLLLLGIGLGAGSYFAYKNFTTNNGNNNSTRQSSDSNNAENLNHNGEAEQAGSQNIGDEDLARIQQCSTSREVYDEFRLWNALDSLNPIYYSCLAYQKNSLAECEVIKKWKHKGQTALFVDKRYSSAEDFYYNDCRQSAAGALFISKVVQSTSCSDAGVIDACRQVSDTWGRSFVESDCLAFCEASKSKDPAKCDGMKSGTNRNGVVECKAVAASDVSRCKDLSDANERKGCEEIATYASALKSNNPSLLAKLEKGSRYQMLGYQFFDQGFCGTYYQSDLRNLYCNTFLGK